MLLAKEKYFIVKINKHWTDFAKFQLIINYYTIIKLIRAL